MQHGNDRPVQNGRDGQGNRGSAGELAKRLIELSGGKDNVSEVAHCTTRIRLRLCDNSLVDEAGLARIGEVQSALLQAGQLQIIVGPALVFKVHRQIVRLLQEDGPERHPEVQGRQKGPGEPGSASRRESAGGLATEGSVERAASPGSIESLANLESPGSVASPESMESRESGKIPGTTESLESAGGPGSLSIPESPVRATGTGGSMLASLQEAWKQRAWTHQSGTEAPSKPKDTGQQGFIGRITGTAGFLSDIVVPIIPLFIAVGMLLGIIGMIKALGWAAPASTWFQTLSLLTGSAFQIMAVMFGYHVAKRLGGTPVLGAAVGIVMTRPGLLHLSESGGADISSAALAAAPQYGYQGTVIPIILAVLLMTLIEKGLRRIIPASAAFLLIPFLSFVVGGGVAVLFIEPVAAHLGALLSSLLEQVFHFGSTVFGLFFGGVYGLIVLTGLHHGIQAIEVGLISNPDIGVNFLLPIWSMANIAQGGAGLAVYVRTRDKAMKRIALPASITAFLGVTEPVVFGVNLKLGRPFLGAAAGGAAGGAYVAYHEVIANSFGLTGIPLLAFIVPPGSVNLVHYITGFLLAAGTAFAVTWILGVDKPYRRDHAPNSNRISTGEYHENQKDS